MNYLVTGGCGFIGSHLVERLLKEDCRITILDDMSEGRRINAPFDPRITVIKDSVLSPNVERLFVSADVVFHLAALTRPQWSIVHPEESSRTNVDGTVKVFKHCVDHKVKRVVFASSSSAYGEQKVYPTPETAPFNPMCPYALQKSIGEQYAKLFENIYGLEVNSIRPFNVYGTRQNPLSDYSAAVPKFINQVSKGEIPYITGDGEQARDFIYVDDVVELMFKMSECPQFGESFNAGSGTNTSINNLLKEICSLMGKEDTHTMAPKLIEPTQTLADMSKVKRVFDWEPQVSLHEGLKRTIDGTINTNSQ